MMAPTVKHISLDVWQTIIDSNPEFRKKRNQLLADHFSLKLPFSTIEEIAKIRQAWCTKANELVGRNMDSNEVLLLILHDCGASLLEISNQELTSFYEKMEILFLADPPIIVEQNLSLLLLKVKEQNIGLSLLSNTGLIKGRSLRKFFEVIDLSSYFDFQLYSDEIGFSKPNVKAYDLVFENAAKIKDILSTEILHIGDNEIADYHGAIISGFQAKLIDPKNITLNQFLTNNVFNIR